MNKVIISSQILFGLVLLILFSVGCSKPDLEGNRPVHTDRTMVFGHGGGGFTKFNQYFPVNSMSAIRKTIEGYGADGVELDVQFTRDMIPVLFHGFELHEQTNCQGPICGHSFAELQACYFRHNINAGQGINQAIVGLEQLLDVYKHYPANLFLALEVKLERFCYQPYETTFEFADIVNNALVKANLSQRTIIEAKDVNFMNYLGKLNPNLILIYYAGDYESGFATASNHGYDGFLLHHKRATADQVRAAQQAGFWLSLFGVRTFEDNVAAIKKGPEFIVSDNIPLTLGLINQVRK